MKNKFTFFPLLALMLTISLSNWSCFDPEPPYHIFTWTFDGVTDTSSLDFASLHEFGTAGESKIIAGNGYAYYYEDRIWISLPSLNSGTYALGPGTSDTLKYFDILDTLQAINGTVNITEFKDSYISGNFSATLVNPQGTNKSISGNFSGVEVDP